MRNFDLTDVDDAQTAIALGEDLPNAAARTLDLAYSNALCDRERLQQRVVDVERERDEWRAKARTAELALMSALRRVANDVTDDADDAAYFAAGSVS